MAVIAAMAIMLSACGTQGASTVPSPSTGGDGASGATLVIADPALPATLDTDFASTDQSWAVGQNAYRHLVEFPVTDFVDGVAEVDLGAGPVGALAESWVVADDLMSYTFTLREGVQSPFGNELTTADVQWSFERSAAVEGVGLFAFGLASIDVENPVTVQDDRVFTINLTDPSPVFLPLFAIPLFAVPIFDTVEVQKHATDEDPWARDWLATHTAGFGPYHVEEYSPGNQVVWVQNPNYWEGDLPVQRIIHREVPDESTRLSLIREGGVDVATFLGARSRQEAAEADGVKVLGTQGNIGLIVGLNNAVAPFDNVAVRQAVAHAIPVADIIRTVYLDEEFAVDFEGYVPSSFPFAHQGAFDYWPYDFDIEAAQALMEDADVESADVTLTINSTRPEHQQAAILIRDSLAQIGINVTIDELSPARYQEQYFGRTAQMILVQDAAWVVDPAYVTVNYFYPGDAGIANWVNYANEEAGAAMDAAYAESDPDRRFELAGEAYRMVVDDAPWAAYIGTGTYVVTRDSVSGYVWRTDNLLDYKYFVKDEDQ